MKTIGLLGGMSWESTVPYYQVINRETAARLGGLHSAEIVLVSVDFEPLEKLQHAGQWRAAGEILANAARRVEAAGADLLVLCTNTMHKVAPQIEDAISLPLLHIADATAKEILARGLRRVGLLGTRFTMEDDFYRGRLETRHGLEALLPGARDRETVHRVIYDELCRGRIVERSREAFREILRRLAEQGADGVILGCTEISLLVGSDSSPVPLFDTTELHARAAVDAALADHDH